VFRRDTIDEGEEPKKTQKMSIKKPKRTTEKSPNFNWGNEGVKNSNKDLEPRLNFYNNKHAKKTNKWWRKQRPHIQVELPSPHKQLTINL